MMAGGTGGHVFPALEVANVLQQKGWRITWLGTERGIEATLVPKAGFGIIYVPVAGMRGKGLMRFVANGFKLLTTFYHIFKIFLKEKPDMVIGMGGYVSGPGGLISWLMRRPVLIHEQNAIPGFTNRVLAKLAKAVMESYPNTFPAAKKVIHSGNPVRKNIQQLQGPNLRYTARLQQPLNLLIMGGSQGAKVLNETLPHVIKKLMSKHAINVRHQAGKLKLEETRQHYADLTEHVSVEAFVDDMASAYAWADLVICRAGATTIAELTAAGVASILIPYPLAVDDHQTRNAEFLKENKAAILLSQADASVEKLYDLINTLCPQRQTLMDMALAARNCAVLDATDKIVAFCERIMQNQTVSGASIPPQDRSNS